MRMRNIWEYVKETPGNTNYAILKQMIEEYVTTSAALENYEVDVDIADSVDLLGKKASDLQEGVRIDDGKVYGTLKYVTEYTDFSSNPAEQEGYYVALHFACEDASSIKVNGVTLDEDGIIILIIKRKGGKAKVEITIDNTVYVDHVDLSGLTYK